MRSLYKRPDLSTMPHKKPNEGYAWEIAGEAMAVIRQLSDYASTGDTESLTCLKWLARLSADELLTNARTGRQEAVQAALEAVSSTVEGFETCCKKVPLDRVTSAARETDRWPGFLYCHPELKKAQEKTIRLFALGKGTGINYEGKPFSLETPGTKIALDLKKRLDFFRLPENRHKGFTYSRRNSQAKDLIVKKREAAEIFSEALALPKLNRSTYLQWWRVAYRLMTFTTDKNFQNAECFQTFKPVEGAPSDNTELTDAMLRDEIKKKIKQGFRSISALE